MKLSWWKVGDHAPRSNPATPDKAKKFLSLKAKWSAAVEKKDEFDSRMRRKYGPGFQEHWLSKAEQRTREKVWSAMEKADEAFFDYLRATSQWDWYRGVSTAWLRAHLTPEIAYSETMPVIPESGVAWGYYWPLKLERVK